MFATEKQEENNRDTKNGIANTIEKLRTKKGKRLMLKK